MGLEGVTHGSAPLSRTFLAKAGEAEERGWLGAGPVLEFPVLLPPCPLSPVPGTEEPGNLLAPGMPIPPTEQQPAHSSALS